jgi:hypothetical protein
LTAAPCWLQAMSPAWYLLLEFVEPC